MERNAVVHWRRVRRGGMSHVLVGGIVLQGVSHHGVLGRGMRVAWGRASQHGALFVVVVVVHVLLAHEVLGPLVLMWAAAKLPAVSARHGGGDARELTYW